MENSEPERIALSFDQLCVSLTNPVKPLLYNVSGYVAKGGITAIMGASASGKSLLLQALSGRVQDLNITGQVTMDGKVVNPKRLDNPVAYVPQEDSLIGELTAREVTTNAALFKRDDSRPVIDESVTNLLESLGLTKVADGIIGTLIFRGLSGGQKKRVEISSELIASPSILLMDEPTSGLDSSIAFDVLNTVRELVKQSHGKLSVILSIHQPNSKILELFDHLLLLDSGSSFYFGTVKESFAYFNKIGFPCPKGVTATDYFLQISDSNFTSVEDFDFHEAYEASANSAQLQKFLQDSSVNSSKKGTDVAVKPELTKQSSFFDFGSSGKVSALQQFHTLVYREYALAYRDPTLYYFQWVLLASFAFFTGAVFFELPQTVAGNYNLYTGGILWLSLMYGWVNIFKVYHISRNDKRLRHEVANNKYSPLIGFLADMFTTASLQIFFIPIGPIAYFMIDFPGNAYPYLILVYWMTSLVSEAMLSFITKFSTNPTISMIFCQIALVDLMVFGGGLFIPWDQVPDYWIWVQEMSFFTQSSRTAIMQVMDKMQFLCDVNGSGQCFDPASGAEYQCASYSSDNTQCWVDGRQLLFVTQGIGQDNGYWKYFAFLICIGVFFKIGILTLLTYPWERFMYWMGKTKRGKKSHEEHSKLLSVKYVEMKQAKKSAKESAKASKKESDKSNSLANSDVEAVAADNDHTKKVSLTWTNLQVKLPRPKSGTGILIDNSTGMVTSGRVLALMGPSGAGKTTLLNALAKRAKYARVTGSVLFAGRPMTATDLTYVPQFDSINGILTVEEHLHLVGSLTCTNNEEMKKRAVTLLDVLGLTTKKDVLVRDLSGGEVKRVSIGIGMISNPYVLFLDEPTTGLDSTAAYSIVQYIAIVAKKTNVAVIMTIHQPSALVFEMLDDLLLLEAGRTVYAGTIKDAGPYFASIGLDNPEQINPADYYLEIAQKAVPGSTESKPVTFRDLFMKSTANDKFNELLQDTLDSKARKLVATQPSSISRFGYLFQYFMGYFLRERGFYVYRVYSLIAIGVFVGTLFLDLQPETANITQYVGAMFFTVISCMLTAVASTAILSKDRYEAVDRVSNGIFSPGVFVMAQFLASAIYNLGASFIFVCLFHWLTNLNPNAECFIYDWLINWGHLMLMESAVLVFIEVLKNDFLSTTSAMIFIGSNMEFNGFFRPVAQMPAWISWMCYIVPLKWSFDGFVTQIFATQNFLVTGSNPAQYISGKTILTQQFHLTDVNSWGMWVILLAYVAFFRFNQYFLFALQTDQLTLPSFNKNDNDDDDDEKNNNINNNDKKVLPTVEAEPILSYRDAYAVSQVSDQVNNDSSSVAHVKQVTLESNKKFEAVPTSEPNDTESAASAEKASATQEENKDHAV